MRKRTQKEVIALGRVESIFRELNLDKNNEGYVPLLDVIIYACAFPEEELVKVVETLSIENYYLGIRFLDSKTGNKTEALYAAMVHTIKATIESGDDEDLKNLELDKMKVILEGKRGEDLEKALLAEIGEKYHQYSNDEKITLFFVKKILKVIKDETWP